MRLLGVLFLFSLACNTNKPVTPLQGHIEAAATVRLKDSVSIDFSYILSPRYDSNTSVAMTDTVLEACLRTSGGQTTLGMIDCLTNAANRLDSILSMAYNKLDRKLDAMDRRKLATSQKHWRAFYKSESDFLYSTFYTWANASKYGHGREHAIVQAEWRYDVLRQRLENLIKYNDQVFEGDTFLGY